MKNKKMIALFMVALLIISSLVGCVRAEPTADLLQSRKAEQANKQAAQSVGEPRIVNFKEKRDLKRLYEARDNAELITYVYTTNRDGKKIFQGRALGFGMNASIQYSNPMKYSGVMTDKIVDEAGDILEFVWDYTLTPQAEPNGLFMPEGLAATYLFMINEETGETYIDYVEDDIQVSEVKKPDYMCESWSLPPHYNNPEF